MPINYASAVVITEGTKLLVGKLATNSRVPAQYTLTTTTLANSGAVALSVTASGGNLQANDDLYIAAGSSLTFGAVSVIVRDDAIVDQTTPTTLNLLAPTSANIASGATTSTRALLPLLGLTEASPSAETTTVDVTNFLSGFGQESVVTGINRNFQCSGNRIQGDRAMDKIVAPLILDDSQARNEIYFELLLPSGEKFEGAGKVMNLNFSAALRDIVKYTFQLQGQGLSYVYTPAVSYLSAKNA
ncbi:hypothetical protein IQ268_08505 [Oculatella sp. LEGE 06141]|uniref:phage tail tube protein n=1 Tax=Oculatella sp. LEGE 06141 TaxID=1828648 RepID=UPI00188045A2|nr:phage tail tube protein [Oculatella sp. LEGE 06141]MBE9178598.1 hypothetical protein [Oculatella sp. LEGE 06141]